MTCHFWTGAPSKRGDGNLKAFFNLCSAILNTCTAVWLTGMI